MCDSSSAQRPLWKMAPSPSKSAKPKLKLCESSSASYYSDDADAPKDAERAGGPPETTEPAEKPKKEEAKPLPELPALPPDIPCPARPPLPRAVPGDARSARATSPTRTPRRSPVSDRQQRGRSTSRRRLRRDHRHRSRSRTRPGRKMKQDHGRHRNHRRHRHRRSQGHSVKRGNEHSLRDRSMKKNDSRDPDRDSKRNHGSNSMHGHKHHADHGDVRRVGGVVLQPRARSERFDPKPGGVAGGHGRPEPELQPGSASGSKDKKYQCQRCSRRFSQPHDLEQHMRSSTYCQDGDSSRKPCSCGKWISDQPRAWEQHYWYFPQCRPAHHTAGGIASKPKAAQKSKAAEPPESLQQHPKEAGAAPPAGPNLRAENLASSSAGSGAGALPNFLMALATLQLELGQSHRKD